MFACVCQRGELTEREEEGRKLKKKERGARTSKRERQGKVDQVNGGILLVDV